MDFGLDCDQTLASTLRSELMPNAELYSESPPSSRENGPQREPPTAASRVKKRVVTAARREQNKAAQQAYRMSMPRSHTTLSIADCDQRG